MTEKNTSIPSQNHDQNRPESLLKPKKAMGFLRKSIQVLREKILCDLEAAYVGALDSGQFASAIKAKELQGKELGFFGEKKDKSLRRLNDLSSDELEELLKS